MAPSNTTPVLDHAIDQAGPLHGAESRVIAPQHVVPLEEEQGRAAKLHKAILAAWSRSARPFAVGGVVTAQLLYLVSKFPEGFPWGPIDLPDVGLGTFMALGSFSGSLVVGGTVSLAKIIAPTPQHYLNVLEAWLMCRMGQFSQEQYYEYVAVLNYQRLYGAMPLELRHETQAGFVRRAVRARAKSRGALNRR